MHKLYSVSYTILCDKQRDLFADAMLFTAENPQNCVENYNTFQEFYCAASSHKYPWSIPWSNYTYGKSLFGKLFVTIYGVHSDWTITEKNFTCPVGIEVSYHECSPSVYGIDFFKKHLSADNFVMFLQEHYGANTDNAVLRLLDDIT